MERQRSFEVLHVDDETFNLENDSLVESVYLVSEQAVSDESPSYTEVSESDKSETSLSTSTFDFVKLDCDQNHAAITQPSPSCNLDQLHCLSIPDEKEPTIVYEQSCIQSSTYSEINASDRIHFYFRDFLLGGIIFSLLLDRIAGCEIERDKLSTNISFLSTEILQKDTEYRHLEIKHKHLKNVTHQLHSDISILTAELRDKALAYNELKSDYKYVSDKMKELTNELRKLKFALMDLKRSSLFFPGIRLIKDILCKILSVCPDLDGE
ncbi:hypothetical protein MS3_00010586 [Schistosoma haematobium]|uniref:Uncharacterized protein n=1 Tax=Schistosoma haematobium TaxID=6185 RepID=A0A922LJC3_SCHHA|nr:hypothetical protein MS3_00010586 [Schistosoma haematobium]KAH9587339.1 hypothetical protein MS3_00010586 [Schistosoma haematobium]